ncbi:MAG: serine hydrolase, partial [Bacteroidota bacterium]
MLRSWVLSLVMILAGLQTMNAQDFAYVANTLSDDVTVIDLTTNTVVTTISVGTVPVDVAVSPDGSQIAVLNAVSGSISLIDFASNTVTNTLTGLSGLPSAMIYDATGNFLYVSFLSGNRIDVVEVGTGTVSTSISVPGGPTGMALRPGTSELYVVLSSLGELGIINASTNTNTGNTILLEGAAGGSSTNPFAVAISADGSTALVPNSSSSFSNVVNLTTQAVSRVQESFGFGASDAFMGGSIDAAISPDGTLGFITEESTGELSIVTDLGNTSVIENLFTPGDDVVGFGASDQPIGVDVSDDGATAVVALSTPNQIAVVDVATRAVVTTVNTGNTPRAVVIAATPIDPCLGQPFTASISASIEQGQSFSFGGQSLTVAGTYTDSTTTVDGCDSITTLTLTVFPAPNPGSVTAVQATLDANIQAAGGLTASVLFSDGSIGTVSNGIANIGTSFGPSIKSGLSDVSQNLMAVLVLRLVEEGLINLTDVFGNGVLAGPPTFFPPNVTIQQLLNHQAGFKNFAANPNYKSNALSILFGDLTTNYSLINYTPILSTYVFPQGPPTVGTFLYSNTNYLAIGEKLEQLQSQGILPGSSLQDLLNQFVLAPGGITDLEFFKIGSTVAPSNASAYFFNLSGIAPEALVDQTSVLTSSGASGSIVATPQAMGQYMRALFQSQSILTSSSLSSLQSFSTISGRESNAYGLGTERFNLNIAGTNYDFVGHYGDLNYTSVYIYSSVLNAGAFVSSNNDEVSAATIIEIARQLIEAGLNPDPCANVTPTTQTVTGEICVGETFTFNGVNYTQTGTFQDTLLNVDGCDSVLLTIDLNVNPNAATSISAEICDNETFAFGGQQLSV